MCIMLPSMISQMQLSLLLVKLIINYFLNSWSKVWWNKLKIVNTIY